MNSVWSRLPQALTFGPSMLLFYLLVAIWIILISLQMRRSGDNRLIARYSFILCGVQMALGPAIWIFFWTKQSAVALTTGPHDPYVQAQEGLDAGIAALLVMSTGAILLCLTGLLAKLPKKEAQQDAA